jgi:hypothetical protein
MPTTSLPIIEGRNFNADLYNHALSNAYRVWTRLYDPAYGLARDPAIYSKVRRDATIAQAIDTRCHMVASRDWHMEPGDDSDESLKAAGICETLIKSIKDFGEARLILAMNVFHGRAYAFMEGATQARTLGDGEVRRWWVPLRLRDVDPRRIRFVPHIEQVEYGPQRPHQKLWVTQEMWSVVRQQYEEITLEHRKQFVSVIRLNQEANLGYGFPLLDSIYFLWWMKSICWREGLQGLERWSQGVVIGKIDSLREGGVDRNNEDVRDDLFNSLKNMRSRHVLVVDKETEIEVKEGGGSGHSMVMDFIKYMDDKLLALILGSVLPFGGGDAGGSYARARVESDTTSGVIQYDRDKLDNALTDGLVQFIWEQNYNNFAALGLKGASIPKFVTDLSNKNDPMQATAIITQLAQAGLPMKLEEVYSKVGLTMPSEDDKLFVLEQPMAQQMPMPDMPFTAETI